MNIKIWQPRERPDPHLWTAVSCIPAGIFTFWVGTWFALFLAATFLTFSLTVFIVVDQWMCLESLRERIKVLRTDSYDDPR